MKRSIVFGLILWALGPAFAFEYNGLEYTVLSQSGSTANVSVQQGSTTPKGALEIPASFTLDGTTYTVISIAADGFRHCKGITSLTLPSTIDSVGDYGFYICDRMTAVSLNEGLKFIGNRAFCNDSALVGTLVIPSTVDSIAEYAFCKCNSLSDIEFSSSTPAKIGEGVFSITTRHAHILIPCGSYDAYAAYYNYYTTATGDIGIRYPYKDLVTDLCADVPVLFDGKLRYRVIDRTHGEVSVSGYIASTIDGELQIPESLTVKDRTFKVVEVDSNVFYRKELLTKKVRITSLIMPSTMRKINYGAFYGCHSLSSVTLNEGLEYIGNRSFCKDSMLTSFTIPSTVTFVGDYAIGHCPALEWVELLPTTPPTSDGSPLAGTDYGFDVMIPCGTAATYKYFYVERDDKKSYIWSSQKVKDICSFNDGTIKYSRPTEDDTEVQVDGMVSGVTVNSLVIPASVTVGKYQLDVTKVVDNAFNNKTFTSLDIAGSVRSIGYQAFRNNPSLTTIRFHEGLQVIGNRAFCSDEGLTMITIPSTVDSIGGYAFGLCSNLSDIYAMGLTPPKRQSNDKNPFPGVAATGNLYLPCRAGLAEYQSVWSGLLKGWTWSNNCDIDIYHHNFPNADALLTEIEGDFDADRLLYHRIFTSGQWETLYLPFDVESVTLYDTDDGQDATITPWIYGTGGNFYLVKQLGLDADGNPAFATVNSVQGYTPYLIRFEHNWYDDKVVTFRSTEDPTVETTFSQQSGVTSAMYGNPTLFNQSVQSVYLLEEEGENFRHSSASRTLYPFECYVADGTGSVSSAPRRFTISWRQSMPTDGGAPAIDGSELAYTVNGKTLTIFPAGEAVTLYAVNGVLLHTFPQGTTAATINLEQGYYIISTRYGSAKIVL